MGSITRSPATTPATLEWRNGSRTRRIWRTDEFIDNIPFPETQNYVKRILGTTEDYRRLYGNGPAHPQPTAERGLMTDPLELTSRAEATHFWFRGFREFVTPVVRELSGGRRDLRIIDCGCGTGHNIRLLQALRSCRRVRSERGWRGDDSRLGGEPSCAPTPRTPRLRPVSSTSPLPSMSSNASSRMPPSFARWRGWFVRAARCW